jgi:hypothetical protein
VRQKLEKASSDWSYIHTHFGVGYRFEPEGGAGSEKVLAPEPVTADSGTEDGLTLELEAELLAREGF